MFDAHTDDPRKIVAEALRQAEKASERAEDNIPLRQAAELAWLAAVATPMAPPKQRTVAEFLALKDLRSMLIGPDWYTMECPKGCPPGRCNATDDPCSLMERQREKQTGRD